MKHLIFGSGLIGSYLAGCFHLRKNTVYLLGRDQSKVSFSQGFTLSDFENNFFESHDQLEFVEHNVFSQQLKKPIFDIIWLTVKCTSIDSTIEPLKSLLKPSSIIICCQNGFGSEQLIQDAFPNNTVISAVVGFNVVRNHLSGRLSNRTRNRDNHWHRSTEGSLIIEAAPETKDFDQRLQSELLPIRISNDIKAERWAKLQLNLANAVNALADVPIKQMLESRGYRLIIAQLMRELLAVTNALGLNLPKVSAVHGKLIPSLMSLPDVIFTRIAQKMLIIDPQARTSMWHDLNKQCLTEINFINGAVSRNATKLGIGSPCNDAIISLVNAVERGEERFGFSAEELKAKLKLSKLVNESGEYNAE